MRTDDPPPCEPEKLNPTVAMWPLAVIAVLAVIGLIAPLAWILAGGG